MFRFWFITLNHQRGSDRPHCQSQRENIHRQGWSALIPMSGTWLHVYTKKDNPKTRLSDKFGKRKTKEITSASFWCCGEGVVKCLCRFVAGTSGDLSPMSLLICGPRPIELSSPLIFIFHYCIFITCKLVKCEHLEEDDSINKWWC